MSNTPKKIDDKKLKIGDIQVHLNPKESAKTKPALQLTYGFYNGFRQIVANPTDKLRAAIAVETMRVAETESLDVQLFSDDPNDIAAMIYNVCAYNGDKHEDAKKFAETSSGGILIDGHPVVIGTREAVGI